mmetsp:Transcript_52078/g.100688  ORF Transcript_52078/g.100688 Transcript_52078/m.100688 type:complete len:668 (-) Transcript_52078:41-2044(-)
MFEHMMPMDGCGLLCKNSCSALHAKNQPFEDRINPHVARLQSEGFPLSDVDLSWEDTVRQKTEESAESADLTVQQDREQAASRIQATFRDRRRRVTILSHSYTGTSEWGKETNCSTRLLNCHLPPSTAYKTATQAVEPGTRVRLRGMHYAVLNCLDGIVEQRANNRYTVRISEMDDTIKLLAQNMTPTGELDTFSRDSSCGSSSRSEIFDANAGDDGPQGTILEMALRNVRKKSQNMLSRFSMNTTNSRRTVRHSTWKDGATSLLEKTVDHQFTLRAPLLEAWWAEKKQQAKEQLLEISGPIRTQLLEGIKEFVVSSALRDPDMWTCLRPTIKSATASLLDDIILEIQSNIEVAVIDRRGTDDIDAASRSAKGPCFKTQRSGFLATRFLRWRAWILFHYLPYNRTIFGKLKDPIYITMVAFTMMPLFGVRFFFFSGILIMLLIPGPADEYQLVNFILHFKGTMFFTTGVLMALLGAMQYFCCYLFHINDVKGCIAARGPGANEWFWTLVVDYFGSISLVWIAWLVLPRSRKFPAQSERLRGNQQTEEQMSAYCCCLKGHLSRGGRLGGLLHYDVVCFVISFCAMAPMYVMAEKQEVHVAREGDQAQAVLAEQWLRAKAVVYWCQVVYALFSLPFALFIIPVFSWLLTHSTFTGFNENGACVEFAWRA